MLRIVDRLQNTPTPVPVEPAVIPVTAAGSVGNNTKTSTRTVRAG